MTNNGGSPVNQIDGRRGNGPVDESTRTAAPPILLRPGASKPIVTLLEREPAFWRFASNLAACISAPPAGVPKWGWKHAWMFRSSFLQRGDPSRGLLLSLLLHVVAVTVIISAPLYHWDSVANSVSTPPVPAPRHEVIYFSKADLLPLISPPRPKTVVRRAAKPAPRAKVQMAYHPVQTIISRPPAPDNRRQTIVQPEAPPIEVRAEIRVPNLIRWSAPELPPPAVPVAIRRATPAPSPPVVAKSPLVAPAMPKLAALNLDASAIPVAPAPGIEVPKLAVPVRVIAAAKAPATTPPPPPARTPAGAPELPAAPAMDLPAGAASLPSLVAISVAPAPPTDTVDLPRGSRAGEFAAAPEGHGSESVGAPADLGTIASTDRGRGSLSGDADANIHVPDLSITGGDRGVSSAPSRAPDAGSDLQRLIASASRPSLSPVSPGAAQPSRQVESEYFGTRRVYTVYMNMPNLSSGSGSWVLRFAEMSDHGVVPANDGKLLTPEAIRKVDPMYEASAAREKVQGSVTLAAVVMKDGTVSNVRVVRSLDPRLDSSAVAALTQWLFQPARKNGSPVDLEVLVQIPFALPSL
jgi:TonB family protein